MSAPFHSTISSSPAAAAATSNDAHTPLRPYHIAPHTPCPHCRHQHTDMQPLQAHITPFAGRIGGNQEFIVDRSDPLNQALISKLPDAAPHIPLTNLLSLSGFRQLELWKAAMMEGVSSLIQIYATAWISISPHVPDEPPNSPASVFATAHFLGHLLGGITNAVIIPICIYAFGSVSGGHLNPLITIATFFARLTTLTRMVLYVAFELIGATPAGLLLRASYYSRDLKVGGCDLFESFGTTPSSALAIEFTANFTLLLFAFGVGLDPRQKEIFGPALAPALVGLSVGTLSFGLAWARPEYGGPGINPRGVLLFMWEVGFRVGIGCIWTAAVAASVGDGVFYNLVPPWTSGLSLEKAREEMAVRGDGVVGMEDGRMDGKGV